VEGNVADPVQPVLHGPMVALVAVEVFEHCEVRGQAGDAQDDVSDRGHQSGTTPGLFPVAHLTLRKLISQSLADDNGRGLRNQGTEWFLGRSWYATRKVGVGGLESSDERHAAVEH